MSVTIDSIVMALLWFTLGALLSGLALRKTEKWGPALIGAMFLLTSARLFLPVEAAWSVGVPAEWLYPALTRMVEAPVWEKRRLGHILLLAWLAGTAFRLLRLLQKLFRRGALRNVQRLDPESKLMGLAREAADRLDCHKSIRLAVAPGLSTAYQAGLFIPCILLPPHIDPLSDQEVSYILRHELCHLQRRDLWLRFGLELLGCVLWWTR